MQHSTDFMSHVDNMTSLPVHRFHHNDTRKPSALKHSMCFKKKTRNAEQGLKLMLVLTLVSRVRENGGGATEHTILHIHQEAWLHCRGVGLQGAVGFWRESTFSHRQVGLHLQTQPSSLLHYHDHLPHHHYIVTLLFLTLCMSFLKQANSSYVRLSDSSVPRL